MRFGFFPHKTSLHCDLPKDIKKQAAHWLLVCPVHFIPDRDTLVLTHPTSLELSFEESTALVDAFNAHFINDDIQLNVISVYCWALKTPQPWHLSLPSLNNAVAMNLKDAFQKGKDAGTWRKLLNETQMLWFNDAINAFREQHGKLAVNGLWVMSTNRAWWKWWEK